MSTTIDNPITGYSMTFLVESNEVFRFSETGRPGAPPPPLHVHPYQEERFEIIRGTVTFRMAADQITCRSGQGVSVPVGVPHTFHNDGADEFEMIGEYRPGLPELSRRFHEVYFALARAGLTDAKGMPKLWQAALEMPLVSDHVRLASPPWPIQKLGLTMIRPIARVLGYRTLDLRVAEPMGLSNPT
jgi:mannose-6-phosphate isomerase-like protein (cupin superfamily)